MPALILSTERLILRHARPGDLHDLHAMLSDPVTMRFWSTPPHVDLATTAEWLAGMIAASAACENYVIEEIASPGRVIGKAGCWRIEEVGMLFHPEVWGRGYAVEALRLILPRAFAANPGLEQIIADIDPRNTASARVLQKLGFVETGRVARTFCVAGEWSDSQYFALPRPTLA